MRSGRGRGERGDDGVSSVITPFSVICVNMPHLLIPSLHLPTARRCGRRCLFTVYRAATATHRPRMAEAAAGVLGHYRVTRGAVCHGEHSATPTGGRNLNPPKRQQGCLKLCVEVHIYTVPGYVCHNISKQWWFMRVVPEGGRENINYCAYRFRKEHGFYLTTVRGSSKTAACG